MKSNEYERLVVHKKLHKELKKAAAEDERSMRGITKEAIEKWLQERKERVMQRYAILPRKKQDEELKDDED